MSQENENTKITPKDIQFIQKSLEESPTPLKIDDLVTKLAFKKKSSQLSQEVKKYDPNCVYEVDDLIYKEYDEPLTVSSKGAEPFKEAVVLKVVQKIVYNSFDYEMLEVDFTGGGIFRKYIDYMKKTKTQVLLPSNFQGKGSSPEIVKKDDDPRFHQLPMTERDLKKLSKNLNANLSKSDIFFSWNNHWQLFEKKINIEGKKIETIRKELKSSGKSASTIDLVAKHLNISRSDETFDLTCMSLNVELEKKYKKDFIYVSPEGWGRWHLKTFIDDLPRNLALSSSKAKVPSFENEERPELSTVKDFPLKIYLTWREIVSGGVKIPRNLNKELSYSREYIFTDTENGIEYTVYYYPSHGFFLGLKEFYEENNLPQGSSLTLERKEPARFNFWVKKSKKKLSVLKLSYDVKKDRFLDGEEEVFTFAIPNKIIHLEKETVKKLFSLYESRKKLDLRELLVLIFKNFGMENQGFFLHYLRAYHLADMLKRTTQEDIERTLINSHEFQKSEKKKGLFSYMEKVIPEEEIVKAPEVAPEAPVEEKIKFPSEQPAEAPSEEIRIEAAEAIPTEILPSADGEYPEPVEPEEIKKERETAFEEAALEEPPHEKKPEKARKEKVSKKKRVKLVGERMPRGKKGAKRILEEQIELEESEREAYVAIKAKEKKETVEIKAEDTKKEKKEHPKTYKSEEPVFGMFAEKLKSALNKKETEPSEKSKEKSPGKKIKDKEKDD
ncbi:MAG: hypothetical protein JXB26_07325 [Candidatus Aminicenantes bacterium]|nr:hypothetical protein [Candidatus Aminicenantes bacterium]